MARLLTPDDLAKLLHVSKTWLYKNYISRDDFPKPVYLGEKSPRWFEDEVVEWLKKEREKQLEHAS